MYMDYKSNKNIGIFIVKNKLQNLYLYLIIK